MEKQNINCQVFDCSYCDCDDCKCTLNEIEVCSCYDEAKKEATMCNSYKKNKD